MLRITRERRDAVGAYGVPFTQAVEEGLDLWLAREKRRKAKPARLARHLTPPTAREIAARTKDDA